MELLRITQEHPYLGIIQPWYEVSFPPEERREFAQLRQLLGCSEMYMNVLLEEQRPVGFIIYWRWDDLLYIEHFAIDPELRGKQVGQKVLPLIINLGSRYMILEVELPNDPVSQSRIRFYERAGFVLNQFEYLQPPYRLDGIGVPMKLMSMPAIADIAMFDRLSSFLKENVYERFYQADSTYKPIG
ncbi:GNAT family N-acetyltransferase [Spirosoma sp. SC4-14]|uniref:GNAT family N-acetyltransferase n=1 Tax=Spirosoma sp. SC4-14 TaxID=3128900 RepID=UPI0030D39435